MAQDKQTANDKNISKILQTLFIVAAPSGAGKTSLVRALLQQDQGIRMSVSSTTRPQRPGEQDGDHYHFVSASEFLDGITQGEFLEHAQVFDHHYGTRRKHVRDLQAEGYDVLLEIDWQGAQQIRERDQHAVSIFILPPSVAELRKRLQHRGQDDDAVIERRMRDAQNEMSHYKEFDYLIINDDFDQALLELQAVITSHRTQRQRQQIRHQALIEQLLSNPEPSPQQ